MRLATAGLALSLLGGWSPRAHANDTTARVAVGGLEFTHSRSIRMESEHLVIAPGRIQVDYVYRNTSRHAARTARVKHPLRGTRRARPRRGRRVNRQNRRQR